VRRVGKTSLCQSLKETQYFDCELPSVRRALEDPESFLKAVSGGRIVLDEVHRLGNPSELLKIAADHFRSTRIVATGSSTLGASAKFKDTLTGRKRDIWLTPLIAADQAEFNKPGLDRRFLQGGLPGYFLADAVPERDFQEWADAYWAKDIQELFRLEKRQSFQRFLELLMAQSGGIFEATRFARPCEASRTTISNYLAVLESTHVAHVIRPYSSHRPTEIVAAPKVYGFDTGFVCHYKGWHTLRPEDRGVLWEHYVLNELQARLQTRDIRYWRDKRGHEVDFVFQERGKPPIAIECKWQAGDVDISGMAAFARQYPEAELCVVAPDLALPLTRRHGDHQVAYRTLDDLVRHLGGRPAEIR
jgi:predicted AAA+ superfamily ATPase